MTWMLSKAKAMPSLPTDMMLVWMMWRKRFIRGIFSGGTEKICIEEMSELILGEAAYVYK